MKHNAGRKTPTRDLTSEDLSDHYGLTIRAVNKWARDGCPNTKKAKGGYRFNLPEVKQWIRDTGRRLKHGGGKGGADGKIKDQIDQANLRKTLAMAERYELDVDQRKGQLLLAEDVERGRLERVSYARARLMGGPSTLAPDLVMRGLEEIEGVLGEWVHAVLTDLAGDSGT